MNLKNQKTPRWRLRPPERITLLILGDLTTAIIALLISLYYWSMGDEWLQFSLEFLKQRPPFWFYLLPILWLILLVEIYDVHRAARWRDTLQGVFIAGLLCLGLYLLVYFTSEPNSLPRRGVAAFIISAMLLTLLWRAIYIRVFTAKSFMRKVIIVGAGSAGQALLSMLTKISPPPFEVAGWIDDDPDKIGERIQGFPVLGGSDTMLDLIESLEISEVVIAITGDLKGKMFQSILDSQEKGIDITTMPAIYEELLSRVPVFHLQSDWVIRSFIDQAKYIRVYLPNRIYIKTHQNKFSQSITLNPNQWQNESGFKKTLSYFYNQTSYIIDRKIKNE